MDLQEQYIEDYAEGFNDAAILAAHAPEMLYEIDREANPRTDFFEGFFAAADYFLEQQVTKEMEDLEALRAKSSERNLER